MACACKVKKEIEKSFNANNRQKESKVTKLILTLISKCLISLILIIAIPVIVFVVLINLIFRNRLEFTFPKFLTNINTKSK